MTNSWSDIGLGRTAAGTMFGILASAALANQPVGPEIHFANETRIRSIGQSSTSSSLVAQMRSAQVLGDKSLIAEIATAYEQFASKQKPLEPEFAELLTANLWELYVR